MDARIYAQKTLELVAPNPEFILNLWVIPSVVYALSETNPQKAVELLAWVLSAPKSSVNGMRDWPFLNRLQSQLRESMDEEYYQIHWEKGEALTFESVYNYLQHAFRVSVDVETRVTAQHLLTLRESEILRLMASGMTNPQIADMLVIGAGTVKTHTLNIYRKLDVANRTQAIVHAQELGLLPA